MTSLPRNLDHGSPFGEEQGDERVTQVVGPEVVESGGCCGTSEDPLTPVAPVFFVPRCSVEPWEDERFIVRASGLEAPLRLRRAPVLW
jgi:hypothetical protein